jgi:hypothetical protein
MADDGSDPDVIQVSVGRKTSNPLSQPDFGASIYFVSG